MVGVSEVESSLAPHQLHSQLAHWSVTFILHSNHMHCGVYRVAHSSLLAVQYRLDRYGVWQVPTLTGGIVVVGGVNGSSVFSTH